MLWWVRLVLLSVGRAHTHLHCCPQMEGLQEHARGLGFSQNLALSTYSETERCVNDRVLECCLKHAVLWHTSSECENRLLLIFPKTHCLL